MKDDSRSALMTARVALVFAVLGTAVAIGNAGGLFEPRGQQWFDDGIVVEDRESGAQIALGKIGPAGFGLSLWDGKTKTSRAVMEVLPEGDVHFSLYDRDGAARVTCSIDPQMDSAVTVRSGDEQRRIMMTGDLDGDVAQWWRRTEDGEQRTAIVGLDSNGRLASRYRKDKVDSKEEVVKPHAEAPAE